MSLVVSARRARFANGSMLGLLGYLDDLLGMADVFVDQYAERLNLESARGGHRPHPTELNLIRSHE